MDYLVPFCNTRVPFKRTLLLYTEHCSKQTTRSYHVSSRKVHREKEQLVNLLYLQRTVGIANQLSYVILIWNSTKDSQWYLNGQAYVYLIASCSSTCCLLWMCWHCARKAEFSNNENYCASIYWMGTADENYSLKIEKIISIITSEISVIVVLFKEILSTMAV